MTVTGEGIWLLPYEGKAITCWNPDTGEMRQHSDFPANLQCQNRLYGDDCMERPFGIATSYKII